MHAWEWYLKKKEEARTQNDNQSQYLKGRDKFTYSNQDKYFKQKEIIRNIIDRYLWNENKTKNETEEETFTSFCGREVEKVGN